MPYTQFPTRADDVRDAAILCSSQAKDSSTDARVLELLTNLVGSTADTYLSSQEALAIAEGCVRDAAQAFEEAEGSCRLELRMLALATRIKLGVEGEEELRKLRNGHSISELRSGAAAARVHAYRDHATRMQARSGMTLPGERLDSFVSTVEALESAFAALTDADRQAEHSRETQQADRTLFLTAYRRYVRAVVAVLGAADATRVLPSFYRRRGSADEESTPSSDSGTMEVQDLQPSPSTNDNNEAEAHP